MPGVYSTTATNLAACPRLVCRGNYATFLSLGLCGVRFSLSLSYTLSQMYTFFRLFSPVRSLQFYRIGQFIEVKLPATVIFGHISRAASPGTGLPVVGQLQKSCPPRRNRNLTRTRQRVLSISCQNPAEPSVLFWKYKLSADGRGD